MLSVGVDCFFSKLLPSFKAVYFGSLVAQPAINPKTRINGVNLINARCGLTKKAEPPPTRDVNRDSGTASANGGWLRRLVRHHGYGQNHKTTAQPPTASCTLTQAKASSPPHP